MAKPEPIVLRVTLAACRADLHALCDHLTPVTNHNQPYRSVCICSCHDFKEFQ